MSKFRAGGGEGKFRKVGKAIKEAEVVAPSCSRDKEQMSRIETIFPMRHDIDESAGSSRPGGCAYKQAVFGLEKSKTWRRETRKWTPLCQNVGPGGVVFTWPLHHKQN